MEGHLKGVKGNIMPHRATHLGIFGRCLEGFSMDLMFTMMTKSSSESGDDE